ncbi:DUF4157 domain-containing protein [Myxococcus sp. AS-1-15]|uniref:eCIS core domain-containing protein n=2 Tax=Myxococcus TaxID=32 RepID=UPI001CC00D81|nr:DUF4157 domain-containing protein [Myxococcus sp. AS-1-15]MBZ4401294.1 DUF4157 domain-containing protein [Myxococcus sp. AS-1-15]
MFAPKTTKGLASPARQSTAQPSPLASLASGGAGKAASLLQEQAPRGASWDFSKISISAPRPADRPQVRSLPDIVPSKLVVGAFDHPLEHEADRVAESIQPRPGASSASGARVESGAAPGCVAEVLRSPGRPLDATVRAEFEPRFGQDFSKVRIHADAQAADAARSVDAVAFAFGHHIVLGEGRTVSDRRLLAHELTHVMQQSGTTGGSGSAPVRRPGGAPLAIARAPAPPTRQLSSGPQLPADAQMVELARIEYTQADISFKTGDGVSLGRMAAQMRQRGWDISRPADVVKMSDGRLVSLDHRRLWAADRAGLTTVSARIHSESDVLAADAAARFKIDKDRVPQGTNPRTGAPWKAGDVPRTWGDAVAFRSAGQGFSKVVRGSNSGFAPTALPGGGVRDPSFPATGSRNMPMRVQPGRLEQRIDPGAGGSIIKSGGVRRNVPTGKVVTGAIDGKTGGTGPTGGGPVSGPGGTRTPIEGRRPPVSKVVTGASDGKTGGTGPTGGGPVSGPGGTRTLFEGRGPPVNAITASPHAQRVNATRARMGSAWSMLLADQLSYVRGAELKKASAAYASLERTIEQHREKGIDVTVTVIAEVPAHPDVMALVSGTGDLGQIVRFHDMFISKLSLPASAATSKVATMYDAGGHSRDHVGLGDMTLTQQIRAQLGDKYPVPGTGPRPDFYFVEGRQFLPGYAQSDNTQPASPMAKRATTKGLAGAWSPELRGVFSGHISQMMLLTTRALNVDVDASGMATPRMTLVSRPYAFENGGPTATMVMTGRFKMGEGYPPQAQWFWSSFEFIPGKDVLLEWAHGQDMTHDNLWDALFLWRRH